MSVPSGLRREEGTRLRSQNARTRRISPDLSGLIPPLLVWDLPLHSKTGRRRPLWDMDSLVPLFSSLRLSAVLIRYPCCRFLMGGAGSVYPRWPLREAIFDLKGLSSGLSFLCTLRQPFLQAAGAHSARPATHTRSRQTLSPHSLLLMFYKFLSSIFPFCLNNFSRMDFEREEEKT